jgi:GAF domain-containing protein
MVVRVDDTAEVLDTWPRFSEDALAHGVRSMLGFPLVAGDVSFGAANLYGREVGAFSKDDEARAALFATQASAVLANARAYWAASDLAVNLQQALQNRAVIDQAKGKLMASAGCTADEAFELLVKASQRENVKVREIALRIVERRDLGPA